MRVSLIAPPFIPVPPVRYGGTELFIAQLAEGLKEIGIDVVVYANGESTVNVEVRSLYEKAQWPIDGEVYANLKDINHTSWAIRDAWNDSDIIHLNNIPGLAFSRFSGPQFVYTIHHVHGDLMSEFYNHLPEVNYVTISKFQQARERMPKLRTIHHGVEMSQYAFREKKQPYLAFLGRIAPLKGTHLAIEVAKRSGIPLKIAGEIQPCFRDYYEAEVHPHIDGKFIEYVGEVDLQAKNELLANAMALLFPIQWDEPFGLVMIESMATGTPVLALPGGAVDEVVEDGETGFICKDVGEMTRRVGELGKLSPVTIRSYTEQYFSVQRMVHEYVQLYRQISENVEVPLPSETAVETAISLVNESEDPRAIA